MPSSDIYSGEERERMENEGPFRTEEELNEFAASHTATLYCYKDLFPEYKSSYYYNKWSSIDKLQMESQFHVGDIVDGVVRNITSFGAFIEFSKTTGLLHIIKSAGACCYVIRYFLHCHSLLFSLPNIVFGSTLFTVEAMNYS